MAELLELSPEECHGVLVGGVVGRIALSTPVGPEIVPVNYAVVDEAVVVRTSAWSRLGTYGRDAVLAFEVDLFDHERQRGWSVVARGRAEVVTDPGVLARIRTSWEPQPWADGRRDLVLRMPWTELSGRQLGPGWSAVASMEFRRTLGTT